MDARRKYVLVTRLNRFVGDPLYALAIHAGLSRHHALLETTGRRTGRVRRKPVLIGVDGRTVWFVAVHGRRAAYVRNLLAEPEVRLKHRGRWHRGTAALVPEDDPWDRARAVGGRRGEAWTRRLGTGPVSVRVVMEG